VPPDRELAGVDPVGRGERAGHVACGEARLVDQVVAELPVDQGRAGRKRLPGVEDGRERLVLDGDEPGGVLGGCPGRRGDGDDRLADVADALQGERLHRARLHAREVGEHATVGFAQTRRLRTAEHADDVGRATRRLGVHASETRVGVGASDEGDVDHARQDHVVHVAPAPGEDAGIVRTLHA